MPERLEEIKTQESPIVLIDKNGFPLTQDHYERVLEQVTSLPASQKSTVIDYTNMIIENPISIIDAETGAGKTTQIPKNTFLATGLRTVVTQPRVLATVSNSARISEELLCQTLDPKYTLGFKEIGYRTGVRSSSERTAKLSLHTAGLEMMRQLHNGLIPDILFLDEIQGMGIDLEVILWLFKTRKDLNKRLVIMSATLDPEVFREYFGKDFGEIPLLHIPGRTFPVEHFYHSNPDEAIPKTLELLDEGQGGLVFVSGKSELYELVEKFKNTGVEIPIYPLHAELTEAEQMRAIINPEREQRLIISTPVAEESVTPEGIQFVIDLGTHKVSYPNTLGIEELRKENTSKANSLQRAGRAGRIEKGEYHRFHKESMRDIDAYPAPPISRDMLDREILLFLSAGKDIGKLNTASKDREETLFTHDINTALLPISYSRLEQIGAIDENRNITELGRDLLSLNLDVYHARMLIQALDEGCVEEMIYMVCILSAKGFLGTDDTWKELFEKTNNKQTDLLYYMKMFTEFTSRKLDKRYTDTLAGMGVNYLELNNFRDQSGLDKDKKMLFEMVDLSPIGVKNHKLAEIYNLIFVIQKRLIASGIELDSSYIPRLRNITKGGKLESIQTCFYAGYPFFISEYNTKSNIFTSHVGGGGIGNLEFQPAKTSLVSPVGTKQYVYSPFIIETEGAEKDNLHLASFVTEVPPVSTKRAIEVNESYVSLFKNNTKKQQVKVESLGELEERYLIILEDIKNIDTREEFIETVLPYMILLFNHKFRKFIENNPDKLDNIIQRLTRYLKNNAQNYAHRIYLADLSKTERSFTDDTAIHEYFRQWETSFVAKTKKGKKAGLRISSKDAHDIHDQRELAKLRREFIELAGSYKSRRYNIDTQVIGTRVFKKTFENYSTESPGLNRILGFINHDIQALEDEEIKKVCSNLGQRGKERNNIKRDRKYVRELKNIVSELKDLIDENSVDYDFLTEFLNHRFFTNTSASQKSKYIKAIKGLRKIKGLQNRDDSHERKIKLYKKHTQQFINEIGASIENCNLDIEANIDSYNSYELVPRASELEKYIYLFLEEIFTEEYIEEHISEQNVGEIILELYRNSLKNSRSVDEILIQYLSYHNHVNHIQHPDIQGFVQEQKIYEDTLYSVESSYTSPESYEAIKSEGVVELTQAVGELRSKLEQLATTRNILLSMKQ